MAAVNILIVVDVQNCFIAGGSINGADAEKNIPIAKLQLSCKQINDIIELIDDSKNIKTHVYFTRDLHPRNHASLEGEGTNTKKNIVEFGNFFPNHCRNLARNCKYTDNANHDTPLEPLIEDATKSPTTINNLLNNTEYKIIFQKNNFNNNTHINKPIFGTDLSYIFYLSKLADNIHSLTQNSLTEANKYTIGLKNSKYQGKPLYDNLHFATDNIKYGNIQFNQVTKGEYCKYESYSAFNYHYEYKNNVKTQIPVLDMSTNFSTGLFESILKNYTEGIINITICGLVGTICVLHSIVQGKLLWENLYKRKSNPKITINFIYSLKGTLFLDFEEINDLIQTDASLALTKAKTLIIQQINKSYPITVIQKIAFQLLDFNGNYVANFVGNIGTSKDGKYEAGKFVDVSVKTGGYQQKYLKYKQKYLELKNMQSLL